MSKINMVSIRIDDYYVYSNNLKEIALMANETEKHPPLLEHKDTHELVETLKHRDCVHCNFAAGVIFAQARLIEVLRK